MVQHHNTRRRYIFNIFVYSDFLIYHFLFYCCYVFLQKMVRVIQSSKRMIFYRKNKHYCFIPKRASEVERTMKFLSTAEL